MRRIHWTLPAAALCLVGAIVTGCALLQTPSPTTTVTDASGREQTLSWADFPGEPFVEPADVLAAPRAAEVEQVGDALLADLQAAIDAQSPGLAWTAGGDSGVFGGNGNGYGGRTLHRIYNSAGVSAEDPADDWRALAEALDAELDAQGFGQIEWEFEREPYPHETPAERDVDVVSTFGSLDPAEMWTWWGTAFDGAMWVSVHLADVDRGVGAPDEAEQYWQREIGLGVGGSVISAADEQAYRDGIAPFAGLARPAETHSD